MVSLWLYDKDVLVPLMNDELLETWYSSAIACAMTFLWRGERGIALITRCFAFDSAAFVLKTVLESFNFLFSRRFFILTLAFSRSRSSSSWVIFERLTLIRSTSRERYDEFVERYFFAISARVLPIFRSWITLKYIFHCFICHSQKYSWDAHDY